MYSENFGVTFASDANGSAGPDVSASRNDDWQHVTAHSLADNSATLTEARPAVDAPVVMPRSVPTGVSAVPVNASAEGIKNIRAAELRNSAMVAAVFCLINVAILFGMGQGPAELRLLSCAVWTCVAIGIFLMSRIATVIGLLLIAVNICSFGYLLYNYIRPTDLDPKGMYFVIIFYFWWTKAVYAAVAGSFEYHRTLSSNSGT